MKHLLVTLLAPAPHDPSFDPARIIRLLGPADFEHHWTPQGYSLAKAAEGRRVILHTWPEAGRASLDLYGGHDLRAEAEALAARLGWRVIEAVDEERLLTDLPPS